MSQNQVKYSTGEEPEQRVENETQSLLGSVIEGLRTAAAGMLGTSVNFLLSFFGSKVGALKTEENKKGKRKRMGEAREEGEVNDEGKPEEELDQKRWRPDTVYEAVQQFINNLLGEKDASVSDSRDENMNTNLSTFNAGQQHWNQRPDINFFSDSFVSSIQDLEVEGDVKTTSTPQIFIEEEESSPKVFVFSAEKSDSPRKNDADDNSPSLVPFEEKKAFFMDQIKKEEMKARESARRSPSPLPLPARKITQDD